MIIKILALAILFYLFWGIAYHKRDKSLTPVIFIEYLLIALLSAVLLMGVII